MNPRLLLSNIVLAEDNPADAGLVKEALRANNVRCDLRVIADREEVLAFTERFDLETKIPRPDLLILDLPLPKRDGHEVLSYLRASERCGQTPVVVLTCFDWIGDQEDAEKNVAVYYFRKPASLDQVLAAGDTGQRVSRLRASDG